MNENPSSSPSVESLMKRGKLFLEDSDLDKADEYFDKVLDIDPEYAPAYIGKLCVELGVRREELLGDYKELRKSKKFDRLLGEYGNFQKALRFSDDGYRKKLSGYEQEIKDNFPRIPQKFTDESIKGELARLEKEIADCDAEIAKWEKEANACQYLASYSDNNKKKITDDLRSMFTFNDGYTANDISKMAREREDYRMYENDAGNLWKKMYKALDHVKENKDKKAEYEAKKQEIEPLAGIPCLDRVDNHYNYFVQAMQKEATEDEYKKIAEQFRLLEGYKDSVELADKCGKLVIKARYKKLILEKKEVATEEKYRELSKQFRKMGSYENSAQLADECDKLADECVRLKEREKKARYDALVQEKNNASSEDKYKQLAKEFREMGNYENAAQLANECYKQSSVLKNQREEQERKEHERREEQERKEREQQEEQKRKKKKKWKIGVILHVCTVAGYLYLLLGTNIIRNMWNSGSIVQAHLPLVIFSSVLCVIGVFFLRKSDYFSGFWFNIGMIFVQAITSCVWAGGVGFLAYRVLFYLVRNILTVIIPGIISMVIEGDWK